MALIPLFFLSLHLAHVWAQTSTGSCLDPSASGPANKASCCSGSGNGQATVGSVLYEYTCNSYANNYAASPLGAKSAYACAELCSSDVDCHASSWAPRAGGAGGTCWLSGPGFTLTPDPHNLWVILVNTGRAGHVVNPEPEIVVPANCDDEIAKAQDDCTAEKNDLIDNCTSEKDDLAKKCAASKDDCTHDKDALVTKCTSEKVDLLSKCTIEKDDLSKKCTSEKDDLTKKCTSEKDDSFKQCIIEKDTLTKKLEQDCQTKVTKQEDIAKKCAGDLNTCQKKGTPAAFLTPTCPRDHYKVRIYDGVAFHILCDHHHKVDPYASNGVSSLEACVKLCREDNRCVAADYYPNTTKQCHRKNGPRDSLSRMKSMKGAQAFYKIAYAGA